MVEKLKYSGRHLMGSFWDPDKLIQLTKLSLTDTHIEFPRTNTP
jgi:hypothetical protein